jgi:hypothetical protein
VLPVREHRFAAVVIGPTPAPHTGDADNADIETTDASVGFHDSLGDDERDAVITDETAHLRVHIEVHRGLGGILELERLAFSVVSWVIGAGLVNSRVI